MIKIICGEDFIKSRQFFLKEKKDYFQKNYEVKEINPEKIINYYLDFKNQNTLFGKKICFTTQNIPTRILNNEKVKKILTQIINDKEIIFLVWEEKKTIRNLDYFKKAEIIEFKLDINIFKLLDNFYPSNKKKVLNLLSQLKVINDENLIFYMIIKRIKQLIEIKIGLKPKDLQLWQIKKIESQSFFWSLDKLLIVYKNLFQIDLSMKTNKTPFSLLNSLEFLICYLL